MNGTKVWTVEMVKEELPDVKVKHPFSNTIVTGAVRGRKNQFATVYYGDGAQACSNEYAWETIVHALNNDTPLTT
jgi:hypothetical protein